MELWKDIENYEGYYKISNYGRVKSLSRLVYIKRYNCFRKIKEKIIKEYNNKTIGYNTIVFSKNGKLKNFTIHTLVWDHFGTGKRDGRKLQVDHIDNNKTNNHIDNLQLLNPRENTSKGKMDNGKKTSKYTGVCWHKRYKVWVSYIRIGKKLKHIGNFKNEYGAYLSYKKELEKL